MKRWLLFTLLFSVASASAGVRSKMDCGGSEPNWGMKIRKEEVSFASPSEELPKSRITSFKTKGKVVTIHAKARDGRLIKIQITPDSNCVSDGVGDSGKDTHAIEFTLGEESFKGCCKRR